MNDITIPLLPRDRWRVVDEYAWRVHRNTILCRDTTDPALARRVVAGSGLPDSFTVAERLNTAPLWLPASERDGAAWLHGLVARRVAAVRQLSGDRAARAAAARHVHDQTRHVLELPDVNGSPSAETLWNQEVPYVIDRIVGHCLFGDPGRDPDPMPRAIVHSHHLVAELLDWFADHRPDSDAVTLIRYALAAGLIDLAIKGNRALCPPLDPALYSDTDWLGSALSDAAVRHPMVVDHVASFIAAVGHNPARLVWFTDDLIETAFDLLVIQHLAELNPRLRVLIVPRRRRTDNDATYDDLIRLLRHRALGELAETVDIGRCQITPHGPAMAAPLLNKLHPAVLRELDWADAVVVKGGRNHELLAGTLDRPLWTGYAITREFTESQAGFDGRNGPLLFVHTPAGTRPWWGWRGRAHRTAAVAPDRTIPLCWTTIADRERRASAADPDVLALDLAWLLDSWPKLWRHYGKPARTDINQLVDRLAVISQGALRDRDLIHRARQLTNPRQEQRRDH